MSAQNITALHADVESDHKTKHTDGVDQAAIRAAVRTILEAIGEDPDRDGLLDTPDRVARMYAEVFAGLHQDPAEVLSARFEVGDSELVLVRDISFYSMCEHHLVPFHGKAHVAYVPKNGVVTGLSKLARLVEVYARRPQVQERLTNSIAETLYNELEAEGVFVMMEAEHMCMSMRGVQKPGSVTVTKAKRGNLSKDQEHEILAMLQTGNRH
ncbi:GTP cyclohydrolase I FolE [Alicyclobacillus sp. ALC3]|uniref:GTP cyclohydrolase I FolE n=1 Tax=Alicyclobacillus sp. ALC3 TaxID=2796143 RepID=UPI002378B1DE|nr:GTP cyclohydrolase I FolE [Alicyclobacillus sp. ALC3]WDL99077.1 GTP cyclohydrolase I FolE [Alicyclobacillus sp. ALC3]